MSERVVLLAIDAPRPELFVDIDTDVCGTGVFLSDGNEQIRVEPGRIAALRAALAVAEARTRMVPDVSDLDMSGEWTPGGVGAVIEVAADRLRRSHSPGEPGAHRDCEICRDYESRAIGLAMAARLMGLPGAAAEASAVGGQFGDCWRVW